MEPFSIRFIDSRNGKAVQKDFRTDSARASWVEKHMPGGTGSELIQEILAWADPREQS
jgi:hypothetical protein